MKIVVISASPHRQGTSALLADKFIDGAQEAGHQVYRFDASFKKVHFCIACNHCQQGDRSCTFNDDMNELAPKLIEAEAVIYVTPLYYHDFPSQLKAVIDRYYRINEQLRHPKKTMLLAAAADQKEWLFDGLKASYLTNNRYMNWQDAGMLLAPACPTREAIEATDYPQQAYFMGKNFK
ncbi:MAG: flavodoxin family protein [Candidatus Bruticola sp.]